MGIPINAAGELFESVFHLFRNYSGEKSEHPGTLWKGLRNYSGARQKNLAMRAAGLHGPRLSEWSAFRSGTRNMGRTFWNNSAAGWWMMQGPLAVLQAGMAPQGDKLATFVGAGIPSLITGGLSLIDPMLGLAAGFILDPHLVNGLTGAAKSFARLNQNSSKLNMGGNFRDSQAAYTMRAKAAQELDHSLLGARQHLGREALLMHS